MPVILHHRNRNHEENSRTSINSTEDEAALKIQACWRGNRSRLHYKRRRKGREDRQRPWGFYTHSLALAEPAKTSPLPDLANSSSTKRWLWLLLEEPSSSTAAQVLSLFIIGVIVVSIAGFVLETEPSLYRASPGVFSALEVFCTITFSLEYLGRLAVCEEEGSSMTRFRFIISPMNVFDLMAVVPFYIEVVLRSFGAEDTPALRVFRLVRLVRVIRIFKLGRYATGMRLFGEALAGSTTAISVLIFLLCMGVVVFSSALFYLEKISCPEMDDLTAGQIKTYHSDCEDPFSKGVSPAHGLCCTEEGSPNDFPSVIAAFWWSLVTMTSVGYGDVYPRTTQGKCVGFVAMLVGMVLIALPVAIVGQKFQDVYDHHDLEEARRRAAVRMKVMGVVWSLAPASDVIPRMKKLNIRDPLLGSSVTELAAHLEEVWEQREQLMRERRYELERQDDMNQNIGKLLSNMENALDDRDASGR